MENKEAKLSRILDLGYPMEQCETALKQSNWDVD
jgi:hypothetical protein